MARMSGFFCQDQYLPKLEKLTNEEVGSLIRALMKYHAYGEIVELDGKVGIAFDFIRDDIDQQEEAYRKKCEQASKNRRKGLEQAITSVNVRQRTSTDDNKRDKYNITECNNNITESSSFIADAEATGILLDHNRVLDSAEDAGFQMSNTVRASLIQMYAEHGLEKVLSGIRECVTHGAPNLAYLGAVLKGTGKKKPQMKVLPVQQYDQRDYSGVQEEILNERAKEVEEKLRRKAAGI